MNTFEFSSSSENTIFNILCLDIVIMFINRNKCMQRIDNISSRSYITLMCELKYTFMYSVHIAIDNKVHEKGLETLFAWEQTPQFR